MRASQPLARTICPSERATERERDGGPSGETTGDERDHPVVTGELWSVQVTAAEAEAASPPFEEWQQRFSLLDELALEGVEPAFLDLSEEGSE